MKVLCSCSTCDRGSIVQPKASANGNVDPPGSLAHKARQRFSAPDYIRFSSGGQHAPAPRGDNVLKRFFLRHGIVKRPIEGHLEWARHLNKMTRLLNIDSAISTEQT